jgi:hypothetical protein
METLPMLLIGYRKFLSHLSFSLFFYVSNDEIHNTLLAVTAHNFVFFVLSLYPFTIISATTGADERKAWRRNEPQCF